MRETLTHYNFADPTLQQVRNTIGLTLEESMHRLTQGLCEEPLTSEMVKFYRALHTTKAAPHTRLFDGAIPTLAELRARNIFIILVSNKGRAGLHQLIAQLKIADYIDIVLSAEDVAHRKPDAPPLHRPHRALADPHSRLTNPGRRGHRDRHSLRKERQPPLLLGNLRLRRPAALQSPLTRLRTPGARRPARTHLATGKIFAQNFNLNPPLKTRCEPNLSVSNTLTPKPGDGVPPQYP